MQLRNWNHVIPAAIAGIVATIAFDVVGFIALGEWAVPVMLAGVFEAPLIVGALAHYSNGIILAVIFAALIPLFFGAMWLRGMLFATVQTIFGVWLFMMPLAGMGIMGVESPMGAMMGIMSLVQHWVYGAMLGLVYAPSVKRFAGSETRARGEYA